MVVTRLLQARHPPVRTPVRNAAVSRGLHLRDYQRASLQTIRLSGDGDVATAHCLNYGQSKAVKRGPGSTFVTHVASGVAVARAKQNCIGADCKRDVVSCQWVRRAGRVDHRNFNQRDIAAVADERSISAG